MQHHPPRERNVMEHSQSIASYTFIHPLKKSVSTAQTSSTPAVDPIKPCHRLEVFVPSLRTISAIGSFSSLSMHPAWRRVSSGLGTQLHTPLVMGTDERCQNIAKFIMRRSWEVGSAVFRNRNAKQFWQWSNFSCVNYSNSFGRVVLFGHHQSSPIILVPTTHWHWHSKE